MFLSESSDNYLIITVNNGIDNIVKILPHETGSILH